MRLKRRKHLSERESGFTLLEVMVVLVIVAVVSTVGLMGINKARASERLSSSARNIASYLEKARLDSIRRHANTSSQTATVEVLNSQNYRVTTDDGYNGVLSSTNVALENGVSFVIPNDPATGVPVLPKAAFNWRGSVEGGEIITLSNGVTQASIYVSEWGDITLDNNLTIPIPIVANVAVNSNIKTAAVINPSSDGCLISTNVTSLSLGRNRTRTVQTTITSATGSNVISAATTSTSITVTPTSQTVAGNATVSFSIRSAKKTGTFAVTFSSPCGSKTVSVTVT